MVFMLILGFAMNAILFSDDYIDSREYYATVIRENPTYALLHEFPKTFIFHHGNSQNAFEFNNQTRK